MRFTRIGLAALAMCSVGAAQAQESGWSVSVGARAWHTEWTTFSYYVDYQRDPVTDEIVIDPITGDPVFENKALKQVPAKRKFVLLPLLSVRYGDFFGGISMMPSTDFSFVDGDRGTRKEYDVNIGYSLLPGLAATLGYKKVSQGGSSGRYEPAGPVIGVSANAPLSGGISLYGNLGVGRLKTPAARGRPGIVEFDADYHLTELGLAYTLAGAGTPRLWTITAGYRIQVLSSKQAFGNQDGRDTTQGFTFGALATF